MPRQAPHTEIEQPPCGLCRLLQLQAVLLAISIGLGLALYGLPIDTLVAVLGVGMVVAIGLWPGSSHWVAAGLLAMGVMFVASTLLPPGWSQGPMFASLAMASAGAGLVLMRLSRPGSGWKRS